MLSSSSIAGFATGCRFSAMGTPTRTSPGLLLEPLVATMTWPEAAPSGTRATMNCSALMMIEPSTSPNRTCGRRSSWGRSPLPLMRISPPGRAHRGSMESIWGLPFTFFAPVFRSIICQSRSFGAATLKLTARLPSAHDPKVKQQLQDNQAVNTCPKIVHHNSSAFRQPLQATHRRRLNNIERTEEYKAGQQRLPHNRTRYQGDQLPRDFINHHMRRIFFAASARFQGCSGYANRHHQRDQQHDRSEERRVG